MAGVQADAVALAGLRVLDLSSNHAAYAGRLLADLGADVVRVEPPAGSPVRRLVPVQHLPGGGVFSFAQAFLDAGKRSIMLDLADADGRARFAELAAASDVMIETPEHAGLTETSMLDGIRLSNPSLIVVSISPFGLEGPYAGYEATDLTVLAAGGLLALGG
jgi:benzylsuccinate CoA-transferase BbsE subunit